MTTTAASDEAKLKFATACFNAVEDLGLFFAGEPDARVEAELAQYGDRLRIQLSASLTQCSGEQIGKLVGAILDGIRFRRRQIEASNGGMASSVATGPQRTVLEKSN